MYGQYGFLYLILTRPKLNNTRRIGVWCGTELSGFMVQQFWLAYFCTGMISVGGTGMRYYRREAKLFHRYGDGTALGGTTLIVVGVNCYHRNKWCGTFLICKKQNSCCCPGGEADLVGNKVEQFLLGWVEQVRFVLGGTALIGKRWNSSDWQELEQLWLARVGTALIGKSWKSYDWVEVKHLWLAWRGIAPLGLGWDSYVWLGKDSLIGKSWNNFD